MKKLIFALLAVFVLTTFSSCKKENSDNDTTTLEGTSWKNTSTGVDLIEESVMIFQASGKGVMKWFNYEDGKLSDQGENPFTYTYVAPNGTVSSKQNGVVQTGKFIIKDNTLIAIEADEQGKDMIFTKQ